MADLEYQEDTLTDTTLIGEAVALDINSDFSDTPALAALEAKLMRRRKKELPHTYRRPPYLRYIEYA